MQVNISRLQLLLAATAATPDLKQHVFQQLLYAHSMVPVITSTARSLRHRGSPALQAHLLALGSCAAPFPADASTIYSHDKLGQDTMLRLQAGVRLDTDMTLPRLMLLSACPAADASLSSWTSQYKCSSTSAPPEADSSNDLLPVVEMGLGLRPLSGHAPQHGAALLCSVTGNIWQTSTFRDLLSSFPDIIVLELPSGVSADDLRELLSWLPKREQHSVSIVLYFNKPTALDLSDPSYAAYNLVHTQVTQGQPLATKKLLDCLDKHLFSSKHCDAHTHQKVSFQRFCLSQHAVGGLLLDHDVQSLHELVNSASKAWSEAQSAQPQSPASIAWLQSQHRQHCCNIRESHYLIMDPEQGWLQRAFGRQAGPVALPTALQAVMAVFSHKDAALRRAAMACMLLNERASNR